MARQISLILVVALTIIAFLSASVSATTYFVGDSSNWALPSSSSTFSDWAANKNFVVGDTLVFNFMQGQHDVAEVTESDYNACDGSKPIARKTASPANFTLRSSGAHHFICTVSGHCSLGQRLAINVVSARAPSPSPSLSPSLSPSPFPSSPSASPSPSPDQPPSPRSVSPSPSPDQSPSPSPSLVSPSPSPRSSVSPAPAPARGRTVSHTVGDKLGWNILAGGASAYRAWAANKTFLVGDVLVFNFAKARHDVAELSKANYQSCNTNSTISLKSKSPVTVALDTAGERFFTCSIPGHCNAGQKLVINVASDGVIDTPSPSSTTSAPSASDTQPSLTRSPPTGVTPRTPTVLDSPTATSALQPPSSAASVGAAGCIATTLMAFASLALQL